MANEGLGAQFQSTLAPLMEQFVDARWQTLMDTGIGPRKRLRDYTVATRIDALCSVGFIPEGLSERINEARKVRNGIVHRAQVDRERCLSSIRTLSDLITHCCEVEVAPADSIVGQGSIFYDGQRVRRGERKR